MDTNEFLNRCLQRLENRMRIKIGEKYSKFMESVKNVMETLEKDVIDEVLDIRSYILQQEIVQSKKDKEAKRMLEYITNNIITNEEHVEVSEDFLDIKPVTTSELKFDVSRNRQLRDKFPPKKSLDIQRKILRIRNINNGNYEPVEIGIVDGKNGAHEETLDPITTLHENFLNFDSALDIQKYEKDEQIPAEDLVDISKEYVGTLRDDADTPMNIRSAMSNNERQRLFIQKKKETETGRAQLDVNKKVRKRNYCERRLIDPKYDNEVKRKERERKRKYREQKRLERENL